MNSNEYREWFQHAFFIAQWFLEQTYSKPRRDLMREELLRSSFLDGLQLSGYRPARTDRLIVESSALWSASACLHCGRLPAQGRTVQHDIGIKPDPAQDSGAVVEIKWITQKCVKQIAQDIWKLALTRSDVAHADAVRTYLLLGGVGKPFGNTITGLRQLGLPLRWSSAGRPRKVAFPNMQTQLQLEDSLVDANSQDAARTVLSWGKCAGRSHLRGGRSYMPELNASLAASWYTAKNESWWRLALWEIWIDDPLLAAVSLSDHFI